jgi:hypothetical protein
MDITYLIYRANRVVGRVKDGRTGPRVVEGDTELRAAVAAVLERAASEVFGGESRGGILWDDVRFVDPGSPDHTRVALTGGALMKYGFGGVLASDVKR